MTNKKQQQGTKKPAEINDQDMGEITIRQMELEDLPRVFSLGEEIFTAEKWPNLYRTWDEYEVVGLFASDGEFCLVAEADDRIIGFSLGTLIDKRHSAWSYGYLLWLGVCPEARRTGVGKRLLNRMTALFIEDGARMMILDTEEENEGAVNFFESQGFGNRVEHIYLSKNLSTHPKYLKKRKHKRKHADIEKITLSKRKKDIGTVIPSKADFSDIKGKEKK
ncbi:MAG: N-acetyltransferase family protein [Fibrobacterota bacterium]